MQNKNKLITYSEAINLGIKIAMRNNKNLIIFGLGVGDPKNIFNTTTDLIEEFKKERVFDVPSSENALTGIAIGASLNGVPSILTHQRLDFLLLSMDQLINSASKMHYMFGSKVNVPITIRCMIGRGWGQGPTHSQNFQAALAHFPGLKIMMPTFPSDVKDIMIESVNDKNPVIILEHRWLFNLKGLVDYKKIKSRFGKARVIKKGDDITIVAMSYMTIESLKAHKILKKYNINTEIIDLISIKPLDMQTIIKSIKKTAKLIILDTGFYSNSISSEIISEISINYSSLLDKPPIKLAMPDIPEPTSHYLTKNFYNNYKDIIKSVSKLLGKKISFDHMKDDIYHDIPDESFKGPF